MRFKFVPIMLSALVISGCGANYVKPPLEANQPTELVVSAYTQDGCLEELNKKAATMGGTAKLVDVKSDLGWGIMMWPVYKSYQCKGYLVK